MSIDAADDDVTWQEIGKKKTKTWQRVVSLKTNEKPFEGKKIE